MGVGTLLLARIRPAAATGLVAATGVAALVALPGCGAPRSDRAAAVDDSTYAHVMARLAFIRQRADASGSPDTLRWADSARLAVLDDFGVSAEDLERYAALHGDDPRHMADVWDRILDLSERIASRAARAGGSVDLGRDATWAKPGAAQAGPDSAGAPGGEDEPGGEGGPGGEDG